MKKRYISPLINIEDSVIENMILAGSDPSNRTGDAMGNTNGGTNPDVKKEVIPEEEGDNVITLGKSSWNCWEDDFEDDY